MRTLNATRTRQVRAAAQGLAGRAATVEEAVRKVVALQAQDVRANRLAVRVRTSGLTAADVDAACRDRTVVRTWAMRGTLHMLAAEDFGWVTGLLGPHFAPRGAPRRRRLGLDEATLERATAGLDAELATPLTRAEIVARLADHGTALDARSQAPAHLLGYAALTGQVCRGPDTGKDEATYVLVREWLGPQKSLDEEEALARLAERYLAGHGPATAADLAAWSGLPAGKVKAAMAAVATEPVEAAGVAAHMLPDQPDEPPAPTRLLGHFDAYLLGYRGRELAVPHAYASTIQAGGGFVMPAVLAAGRVVGTWRLTSTKDSAKVELEPFGTSPLPDYRNEVADLGRFLRRQVVSGT
ncbi:MAG: winged helix DNA-binding domain-containing protein [Actinophytocola sp.]|uniref:winged helix DNA-binding domain-containing protein n=1 Tax=Actinophytocola sp. TaxID=1872138 RepID=UPI00132C0B72|nr:winged helix DNA-binding domain-containing protein [Actinophytocola sp.]MPZ85482.1 winged helix DNA-binding domain-containing protein [Actinophytocola sp.]